MVKQQTHRRGIRELENIIEYTFNDPNLLRRAITHKSSVRNKRMSNERLEFLGDAVLELVITEYLTNKFKEMDEGELSRIRAACVNSETLSSVSKELGISEFIKIGKSEKREHIEHNPGILEDAFEAIVGAIYIDGGLKEAQKFIIKHISKKIDEIATGNVITDHKTYLQELTQKHFMVLPEYRIIKEEGVEHNKIFHCEVFIKGKSYGVGIGKSKKTAEKEAAKIAIERLKKDV